MKLSYVTVGSNDLHQAKTFYDALLGSIGLEIAFEHPSGGRVYGEGGLTAFAVVGPFDNNPATVGNGTMVGFRFDTPRKQLPSTLRRWNSAPPTKARRVCGAAPSL